MIARVAASSLTEQARVIVEAEIARRGLEPVQVAGDTSSLTDEPYEGDMVEFERDLSPQAAHVLVGFRNSAAIEAFAGDANMAQTCSLLGIAIGGAKIRVREARAEGARDLLAAFRRGGFELGEDLDDGAS